MIFTPDMNDGDTIFVFGSNEDGLHAGGAAKQAELHWGALRNVGFGHVNYSFAIPTMDWVLEPLPLDVILHYVNRFIAYAKLMPNLRFLVTPIGTGICGYTHEQIAPMFKDAPANCILPDEWKK